MKVTRIIDPQYKTGTSAKTGKPWTLIKIDAEGKEATGFGPVTLGDEVELTFDDKYKNYSFKVLKPQEIPNQPAPQSDASKLVELIYENTRETLRIVQMLAGETSPKPSLSESWQSVTNTKPQELDKVVEDIGDEPMDINDIPF